MLTSVKERLEDAASSVSLTRDGFEPIGNSVPLVMSTPPHDHRHHAVRHAVEHGVHRRWIGPRRRREVA